MNKMFTKKLFGKKGFTLAELLIVIAIIAVLAAIAVPLFSAQLEKAQEEVNNANMRAIKSQAAADFLFAKAENKLDSSNGWTAESNGAYRHTYWVTDSGDVYSSDPTGSVEATEYIASVETTKDGDTIVSVGDAVTIP